MLLLVLSSSEDMITYGVSSLREAVVVLVNQISGNGCADKSDKRGGGRGGQINGSMEARWLKRSAPSRVQQRRRGHEIIEFKTSMYSNYKCGLARH